MAGNYSYIREHYSHKGVFVGVTHGCGCCSHDETVGVKELEAHIEALKKDIESTEKLIVIVQRKAEMDKELEKMQNSGS